MQTNRLLLAALVAQLLCATVLAYTVLPLNAKLNSTLEERMNAYKRSSDNPLGGGPVIGYYFVDIQIGSQTFRVDIDTGSSTLYVVGPYCHYIENNNDCTYTTSYYQGNGTYKSCSSGCDMCQKSTCIMTATYGDGTKVYGAVTMDTLTIGSYSATAPVAVSYLQSQGFAQQSSGTYMDGLWGMAYNSFNGGQSTVIDALVGAGMPNIFSICLSDTGGYLVMGGINTAYQTGSVSYTPITTESYYVMNVNSVAIGSSTLATSMPSLTILDSGTTFSYIPTAMYNEMATTLKNAGMSSNFFRGDGSIGCAVLPTIISTLPNIIFTLPQVGGGTFTLTFDPSQYTVPCSTTTRAFGFQPTDDDMAILGDTFMRPWNNIFDRANGQIGFAAVSSSCSASVARTAGQKTVPSQTSPFSAATASYTPGVAQFIAILAACIIAIAF